ncbi:succinylglutamate desuccinylase/aspartoacylase family protein [uncultured Bacteroides sp.]|uniref:succinylglutamate desuccinylase/aspartoacylase domain-containing protein n=1 Tax=uncultured Bacteroides sp. TaxID=162156 RepID=UPI00260B6774|nr:succinylglutamate desuccinylase/aspartoacylase family protein [uncultured Bacteroides sp.]
MKQEILFSMQSPFRDTFQIKGYRFGQGEKCLAIVGAMRGDEIQQLYICSQIVKQLCLLEKRGQLKLEKEILVIPSANPFSMNIGKRFWAMDNTDINRMFPGYDQGETTQRIAAGIFKAVQGYEYGIQMASSYMNGEYIPHVRITQTGYEDVKTGGYFGLPYICLRKPLPFDTTLLNYNWQIWETKAYSIYAGENQEIDNALCRRIISSIFRFMKRTGIIKNELPSTPDYNSIIFNEEELITIKSPIAGIFYNFKKSGDEIRKGELLAQILHPCDGSTNAEIVAPEDGVIFFNHNKSLALQNTPLFRICASAQYF